MNILVADADEETRLTLVEAIAAIAPSARVTEASHGAELRAALAGTPPDILFIDTILPDTDGRMVTSWREGAGAGCVVVLVADLLASRWSSVARLLDAYDVLLKPVSARSVGHVLQAVPLLRRDLTVLLVEPGERTREVARQMLGATAFRFRIAEAAEGRAAVKAARAQAFDLVIIGSAIPDMPASEAACRLDALATGARIVIAGSAVEEPSAAQLALFGVSAYLRMPFDATDLDRLVYGIFGLWRPYLLDALRSETLRREAERIAAAQPRQVVYL
jgi:CheY-like chemotaxis protein